MKLKVYGCRGSVPTSHTPPSKYGGNTSCISVETDGHTLVLDAGSGLAQFEKDLKRRCPEYLNDLQEPVDILISHLHMDHIIGLPVFGPVWNKSGARIYTCFRGEDKRSLKKQILGIFRPPYWPTSMAEVANVECVPVRDAWTFTLGPYNITPFAAVHPDTTLSFYITNGEKTIVHLLDSETSLMAEDDYAVMVGYCTDADMVVFDAAYSPEDYIKKKGWGHSTIEDGIKLAERSNCKRMLFSHFSFEYTDEQLEKIEARVPCEKRYIFARDGLEIEI